MTLRMGAHVGQLDPVGEAAEMGASLAQLMIGSPKSWATPEVSCPGGAAALRERAAAADVDLYVHAAYIINVATGNNRVRIPSRGLLQKTVHAAHEIGAKGVIVHGGHVTDGDDLETGFDNWRKCVERLELPVPILVENTAGGARAIARGVERIGRLWEAIGSTPNADSVGFCLDTCHAHAGGEELIGLVDRVRSVTGRIDLVHCNDSKDAFNSGADRHENLGKGQIQPEVLVAMLREAGAPLVLETPGGVAAHTDELIWLREQLG